MRVEAGNGGLRARIVRGLGWSAGRTLGSFVLQFATIVVVSRLLSPVEVGVVAVGFGIVQLVLSFSLLGVDGAIIQRQSVTRDHVGAAFLCALCVAVLLVALIWSGAGRIARVVDIPEAGPVLAALSVIVPLHALAGVFDAIARRELMFRLVATVDLVSVAAGHCAISIGCALGGLGLWSLVAGHVGYFVVRTLLLGVLLRRRWALRASRRAIRDLFRFGIPVSFANAADQIGANADRILVGGILGAEIAGLFHRSRQALQIAQGAIQQPLAMVLFPAMSRVQDERHKLSLAFRSTLALIGIVALPAGALICLTADPLVVFLLGPQWEGVVAPLRILAVALFLRTHDGSVGLLMLSANRVRQRAAINAAFLCLLIAAVAVCAPRGIEWVCAGIVAAMAVNFCVTSIAAARILGVSFGRVLAPLAPGALAAAVILAAAEACRLAAGIWAGGVGGSAVLIASAGLFLAYFLLIHPAWPVTAEMREIRKILREGRGAGTVG